MAERIFRRGEIYWVNLPDKGGYELKDPHMGLIISNNRQNQASPLIIILPLTSLKAGDKVYSFEVETFINNKLGKILVDQIITTDKVKRVGKLVGQLDKKSMLKVERAICYVLALSTEALVKELTERKKKIFVRMTIIAFISQKGGVGKSTLSQALATEASQQKLKTLLVEYDPQQKTSQEWSQRRKQKNKYLVVNSFTAFKEIIKQNNS